MGTIAKWNGHTFVVNAKEIRSFENLQVKASCVTEDKTLDGEQYAAKKTTGAYIITLTVVLDARTANYTNGVQSEAMSLCSDVYNGAEGFFYAGNAKLFTGKLIGSKATVQNIEMDNKGGWIRCEVALEMKQSTKADGTLNPAGGAKKSKKKTVYDRAMDAVKKGWDAEKAKKKTDEAIKGMRDKIVGIPTSKEPMFGVGDKVTKES